MVLQLREDKQNYCFMDSGGLVVSDSNRNRSESAGIIIVSELHQIWTTTNYACAVRWCMVVFVLGMAFISKIVSFVGGSQL